MHGCQIEFSNCYKNAHVDEMSTNLIIFTRHANAVLLAITFKGYIGNNYSFYVLRINSGIGKRTRYTNKCMFVMMMTCDTSYS